MSSAYRFWWYGPFVFPRYGNIIPNNCGDGLSFFGSDTPVYLCNYYGTRDGDGGNHVV